MNSSCTKNAQKKIAIGDFELRNNCLLAPMSGVTDVPFRRLAWRFGAGMVVSEMVASEALTTGQEEMRLKAESAGLPVHMVQLAGREAEWMARAAQMAEGSGADIIDINMGCPSKRVTNGYSGSALMRDLDHALRLIDAVTMATDLPVTLKMRLGWDEHSINAPQLASRAEAAGIKMITVHGRTRNQFYKGQADWEKVALVREEISIPLIVNGDITSLPQARQAIEKSGADGVMVGRASYGAPWLPGAIGQALAGQSLAGNDQPDDLNALILEHYDQMLSFYGVELGVRNARKHLGWYLDALQLNARQQVLRREILPQKDPQIVISKLQELLLEHPTRQVAA